MQPVKPFSPNQSTPEARRLRIERSLIDFWFFDKTYFPPELYEDFRKPGKFHYRLVEIAQNKDKKAHVIIGARGFAKTITLKKDFYHKFLFGLRRFMAFGSDIMPTAYRYLKDLIYLFDNNERIKHDFDIEFLEKGAESVFARSEVNPRGTFVVPLSEERSSRGEQRLFERLDYVLLTDFENETSALSIDPVEKRIKRLNEMRTSLSDKGCLIWEGNNFDVQCAMNYLVEEMNKGILSENVCIHLFPAWLPEKPPKQRSLWFSKYPFTNETDFWKAVKPLDELDKAGNYQGRPVRKKSQHFPKDFYLEWSELPNDIKSVLWTDPNCSLKDKGDTTAMLSFGFSASTQNFYINNPRCKSYFDSDELLKDFLTMRNEVDSVLINKIKAIRIVDMGMDGNVAQESTWENNILQFTRLNGFPYPAISFKKYNVDDMITPVSKEWKRGRIFFPPGFSKTSEGAAAIKQVETFTTKKAKRKDDFPDAMISAYHLLIERGAVTVTGTQEYKMQSFSNRNVKRL